MAQAVATTLEAGSPATVSASVQDGNVLFSFGIPRGQAGDLAAINAMRAEGAQAFIADSRLRGQRFAIWDGVGGGYAARTETTATAGPISSVLTVVNSTGGQRRTGKKLLEPVAANGLRHHHQLDGSAAGLLIEGAATKILPKSEKLNEWSAARCIVTSNARRGQDGNQTGDLLVTSNGQANGAIYRQDFAFAGASAYTYSGYVEPVGATSVKLELTHTLSGYAGGTATFTLTGDGMVANVSGGTAGISLAANGAYFVWLTVTTPAQPTYNYAAITAMGAGDGVSGLGLWGFGLEAKAFPSSYVATDTAPVSRAADAISQAITGFTANEITLAADFLMPSNDGASRTILQISDGTASNRIALVASGTSVLLSVTAAGVTRSTAVAGLVPGNRYRAAGAYSAVSGRRRVKATGLAAPAEGTDMSAVPAVPTRLDLGSALGAPGSFLDQCLLGAAIVDRAWSASELAGWTG